MDRRAYLASLVGFSGCASLAADPREKSDSPDRAGNIEQKRIIKGVRVTLMGWGIAKSIRYYDGEIKFKEAKNGYFVQPAIKLENLTDEKKSNPRVSAFTVRTGGKEYEPLEEVPVENPDYREELSMPDTPGSYKEDRRINSPTFTIFSPLYDVDLGNRLTLVYKGRTFRTEDAAIPR